MKGTQPASCWLGRERKEPQPWNVSGLRKPVASEKIGTSVLKPQGIHSANNLNE